MKLIKFLTTNIYKDLKKNIYFIISIGADFLSYFVLLNSDTNEKIIIFISKFGFVLFTSAIILIILQSLWKIINDLWTKNEILLQKNKDLQSKFKKPLSPASGNFVVQSQNATEIKNIVNNVVPSVLNKDDALGNPDLNSKKLVNNILDNPRISICNKVDEISLKYCKKSLDITSKYEDSIIEFNEERILESAGHFCGMFRSVVNMLFSIPGFSTKEDYISFLSVLEKLENWTKERKSNETIKKQIISCEKAIWRLIAVV